MAKLKEIKLNQFQLNVLLNEKEKKDYDFLLNKGVVCMTCSGICEEGVEVHEIMLNGMNDIVITGSCKKCKGRVARVMEFGEDPEFYEQAVKFRKSIE